MAPSRRPKLSPAEAFKRAWSAFGQDLADFTGEPTILVRDTRGVARFTVNTWPLSGELIATFEPRPARD